MSPVGQSVANCSLAGPGALTDIFETNSILTRVATADDTESEVRDSFTLLVIATEEPMGVMRKAIPFGSVRTGSFVLSAFESLFGTSTPDTSPMLKLLREMVLAPTLSGPSTALSCLGQTSNGIAGKMGRETFGSNPKGGKASLPCFSVIGAVFAGAG